MSVAYHRRFRRWQGEEEGPEGEIWRELRQGGECREEDRC
jgi:hypothetical protein